MNTNPQQLTDKKRTVRCVALLFILLCILPVALNITCLTPIYFSLNNNTLYSGGAIIITLEYLMDFFDLLSFTSVYSIIIFALVFSKKKLCTAVSISYVIFLLLKIPARILMNLPLLGTIGDKAHIIGDLLLLSSYFIIELAQFLTVLLTSVFIAKSYNAAIEAIKEKGKKAPEQILPIKKIVNWYNPLLRAGIFMSIIITAFKFLSRLITDIEAGLPSSFAEVMIITVNYLADAIYGFSAYIIAILIFNVFFEKIIKKSSSDKKSKADEESSSALFKD